MMSCVRARYRMAAGLTRWAAAQTNPASSRATATTILLRFRPRALSLRNRAHGAQAQLRFPGDVDGGFRQIGLAPSDDGTHSGVVLIGPGGFDQSTACGAITGFGDRTLSAPRPGGVFAGDHAEVTHERSGVSEAT